MEVTIGQETESQPHAEIVPEKAASAERRGMRPKVLATVAAALAVVAIIALIASPPQSESLPQPVVAAASSPNRSSPATPPQSAQPAVNNDGGGASQNDSALALETSVQQLKSAGNWNVLVLYASEWTRKEPNNAAAWNELSVGYTKLKQLDDALYAATKAAQLAPGDARLWRNLGHVNLDLERLPEAAVAFDKALELSSDDADALCGAALVAQRQGRPKDGHTLAGRLKTDGMCPDVGGADSAQAASHGTARASTRSTR